MAKVEVVSFDDALQRAGDTKKRHLLTGNGFSMAWDHTRFAYSVLLERAGDSLPENVQAVFKSLETSDFEIVMRLFRDSAKLLDAYSEKYPVLVRNLAKEANKIRDALATAVAASHPDRPSKVKDKEYVACRRFLSNFDCIYTLNYDLLLYWAMMHDEAGRKLKCDDGFREPEDGPNSYVTWDVQNTNSQNIHYLHGALHIFDAGHEIQKYTWSNTGVPLVDQIRDALDEGKFPIFVSEGRSEEKLTRIQHSSILSRAYRSFANLGNALFIYGHSLAENDEHILKLIDSGKMDPVCIGIYGDPENQTNRKIIKRGQLFDTRRNKHRRKGVDVIFYDASTAKVWGK